MSKFLLVKGNLLSSITQSLVTKKFEIKYDLCMSWRRQEKTVKCPHLQRVNFAEPPLWSQEKVKKHNNKNYNVLLNNKYFANLVPRFSLLPVERPWLGLVTCLPESGRLQTNDSPEGRISVRFVSTKRRCRGQWKLCI